MNNMRHYPALTLTLMALVISLFACTGSLKEAIPSSEFAPYVNAYTGGAITQSSPIRIELTQDQPMIDLNSELKENPFSFSPSLKGKAYWVSNNTIEFLPQEGALKPGELYQGVFRLGDFVQVDESLKKFVFSFRVQESNFLLNLSPLEITATAPTQASLQGEIRFSDKATAEEVQRMVSVDAGGKTVPTLTIHATHNPSRYTFSLNGIEREKEDYELTILANGKSVGIDRSISQKILVPAQDNFRFLTAKRIEQPENGVQLLFSDPLESGQELKGLIEIVGVNGYITQVVNDRINIYFDANQRNTLTLNIHQGVKNYQGKPLSTSHTVSLSEQNLKPAVEMLRAGAILPDSKNLIIPFRAVNLFAVDLSIIRIYESNVLMFMQTNSLSSANDLRRSGRLVYKKTLNLSSDASKEVRQWEDYSVDLSGVIKQEPGAIYRVILSFKQAYSAYPCGDERQVREQTERGQTNEGMMKVVGEGVAEADESEWDTPQAYYYYNGGSSMDWSLYKWTERENPCHPSYYMTSDRAAMCNVFASNLGMIVKRNSMNKVWVAVSNILTTDPVKGAQVTAYNFQLQPLAKAETDKEGFATLDTQGVPFIVMAQADQQKAYVKVADGEEQSVSRFDVGGKETQKGLKGFIYGERGVWRPGDTLHISFMLEDRERRIPNRHPVALEVYNPRGQFYSKLISTQGVNGVHTFAVHTQAEDPTGLWNAYIKVGGTSFHKSLRVETVKPNRLKIALQLPGEMIRAADKEVHATLTSTWLTGATAAGLKAKVEMSLTRVNTQFANYDQYLFNNPATEFSTYKTELLDGVLDATGRIAFAMKLPEATNAPGVLNANITSRVYEPGGDASIHTLTVPYSPFDSYVGIRLNQPKGKYIETDKEHTFDVVTVNAAGKPIARSGLEYKIYRIGWSWWWENSQESMATYINSSSYTPVASGTLNTTDGTARFHFRVDYPAWGRYLVYIKDPASGHATGGTIYVDWPEWRGRSSKSDPSGIKMLAFSLDKESYEIGETATVILPTATEGRALVALENGATVLHREWITVSGTEDTKYQFKVTPEMTPNVYLHISLLQPHAQTTNDLPIRMYGVMPLFATNKQTLLKPTIQMPNVLRPETSFNVSVSEKNGKPMTYTLAIVDEGLLDLTNFKTPDPWKEFYAREALGIRTWDMYDHVLGASTGSYRSLFSIGGDEALKPSDSKANRFKPVVKFLGPFKLAKGASATHRVTLPMYVGSVRTMVVAGEEGAYGQVEKTTPVRTPLMVLASLPRVLSSQEEILLPVNVFAMENSVKRVTVSVSTTGKAQVVGDKQQSVTFTQTGDQLIYFRLKTGGSTGKEVIKLTAEGDGQRAKETIEIEIRNPNPVVTLRKSGWVEAGKSCELPYEVEKAAPGSSVRMEVSRIPSVDISRRFDFLYDYRHQCTEQLTSKALPLLFIGSFKSIDTQEEQRIKTNIQDAIKQLYARQLPNGGFIYWPGYGTADEWITSYAGMFLWMAQEKGYAVNATVLNKWKQFQRAATQNWKAPATVESNSSWQGQGDTQQAFRLYTLALAGAPEQGAMNRMKEMQHALSPQAKWRLAATYALTGKAKAAGELVHQAKTTVEPYHSSSTEGRMVYGSSDRDEAMILETLLLMKREQEALHQAKVVSQNLANEKYFTTQSTAFALMAMGRLSDQLSGTLNFQWSINSKQQSAVKSAKAVYAASIATTPRSGKVTVTNQGKGGLSVDLITRTQLVNDTLPAIANNLRVDVKYIHANGTPANILSLKQGSDFAAVVTVANISGTTDYTHLALTHIVPSGWEVYNERMVRPSEQSASTPIGNNGYQDIRDDRVLTYFDLNRGQSKTIIVRLQATYAGSYVLPAIQCEAMYDTNALARTQAGKVTVERQ